MDDEAWMAIIGLLFAAFSLCALFEFRRMRQRREQRTQFEERQLEAVGRPDLPNLAATELPFFIIKHPVDPPRCYRVYSDLDALLFLDVASAHSRLIDADFLRGKRKTWFWQRSDGSFHPSLIIGYLIGGLLFVGLAGMAVYDAYDNPAEFEPGLLVLKVVAAVLWLGTAIVPLFVHLANRRMAELDALDLQELRNHAASQKGCFLATPEAISDIQFKVGDASHAQHRTILKFRHKPTGRWSFELTTTEDTRLALNEFLRVFGEQAVPLDPTLRQRFVEGKQ